MLSHLISEETTSTIGFKIALDCIARVDKIQSFLLNFLLFFFSLLERLITGGYLERKGGFKN